MVADAIRMSAVARMAAPAVAKVGVEAKGKAGEIEYVGSRRMLG